MISSRGNHFYDFCSISSLIMLLCQYFAYMASYLIRIEIIINASLGQPWQSSKKAAPIKDGNALLITF